MNFACLIPVFENHRFLPGGFRVSLGAPKPDDEDGLKTRAGVLMDTLPLPEGVWPLLPNLPLQEEPRLLVKATLHALLLELQAFMRRRNRLEPLATVPGRFIKHLFEDHRNRLMAQPIGGEIDFDRIKNLLAQEFSAQDQTNEYSFAATLLQQLHTWNQAQKELQSIESQPSPSDALVADLRSARESLWSLAQEFTSLDFDAAHGAVIQLTKI